MFTRTSRATCLSLFVMDSTTAPRQTEAGSPDRRRPRRTALGGGIPLLVLGACLFVAPSGARAQTADEIVAANIAASGGREAIARIETLTSTGRVTVESRIFGRFAGTIEIVRVPGRGYYDSVELGPIAQQKGWDGAQAWERGPAGLRMLAGDERSTLATLSFVNPLVELRGLDSAGLRIERLDDGEVHGRPHYALAVSGDAAGSTVYYVDRETGLLTRSTSTVTVPNLGTAPVVVDVGGYEAVEGAMLPTTMAITVEGISTTRVVIERTVANTKVDPSVFAVPGDAGQPKIGN